MISIRFAICRRRIAKSNENIEAQKHEKHSNRMSHHWNSRSSKLTCESESDSFIFTPRGCCRTTPSSDGRGRLNEWMWSSSLKVARMDVILFVWCSTNGCDPLRVMVFEIGWEQRGEGRNFANHWQNTHPTNLKPKRPPQTKIQLPLVCSWVSSSRYCFASHTDLFVLQTVSFRHRKQFFTVLV